MRIFRAFATVGLWTLLSRVFGFCRDILLAAQLGSSPVAQAFMIAFSLPNMFRRFFAEGAFNMAFVPLYSKKRAAEEDADAFASNALSALAAILIVFSVICIALMPLLVWAMAAGFAGDERFDLSVLFGRIAFPYIFFISLAALLSGALNAAGRFAAAAAAPVLLNIVLIAVLALFVTNDEFGGVALSWGVLVAGIAQLALLWVAAKRAGLKIRFKKPVFTPELSRLLKIAAPAALAGGVVQVNLLVGRQIASQFDGAVVWLALADRLYQLPLGLVGVAIGIVLLPELSKRLQDGDTAGGREAFNRANLFALALTLPATVALVAIAYPLVQGLYGRGAFGIEDVRSTALAVMVYGVGLPAFVLQKTVMPLYFAREDTKTPFRFAVVAMVVNAVFAILLTIPFGFLGAAWGTTISSWVLLWLLWRGSRSMGDAAQADDLLLRALPRLIFSALGMGVAVFLLWVWIAGVGFGTDGAIQLPDQTGGYFDEFLLMILVPAGAVVYAALTLMTGAVSKGDLRRAFKRGA